MIWIIIMNQRVDDSSGDIKKRLKSEYAEYKLNMNIK